MSDFGPFIYLFKSEIASRKVLDVWVESSATAVELPALALAPPPRNSFHWLTMVRSTRDVGGERELSCCLAREMIAFSIPDLDAISSADPPRATNDEVEAAE